MARDGSIVLAWADGEHKFRLGIKELAELDEKCDAGPAWMYARIEAGMWKARDLVETLRLGLIGGGMKAEQARMLVRRYVEGRPLHESVVPAMMVLAAAVAGPEDEELPNSEREGMTPNRLSQMDGSGSAPSSAMLS